MRRYYLQSGLWMSVLTVLIFGGLYVAADLNATDRPSNTLNIDGGFWSDIGTGFASDKTSGRSTKIAAQNSFSLSLDANSAAGDQAVTSVNTSADQVVSIQVFGSSIQNASGFGLRFEYDASQVTYQGFDVGSVLPGSPQVLAEHGTNPTFVTIGIASFGSQATVSSGLVGTIRFLTTTGFSGTAVQLVRAELSRSGQSETVTLTARVELEVSTAPSPDFDGDGMVGTADFLLFAYHFGSSLGDGTYQAKYDLDGNGVIGLSDVLIFVDNFGSQVPPSGGGGGGGGGSSGSPDLVVDAPSVSDSTLTTGQSFTLSATVRNQGMGSSAATTLRYYRSSNATISASDTEVGTDSVNGLSASVTSAESISLNAPSSAGTYYYGACVASVSGESNTGNNCSNGVRVTVSSSSGSPDLIVESPSVSDSTLTTGQSFTLSATVRNRGTGSSAATTLRYYRSSNATISTSDTEVGTDSVNGLSASGTSADSISLNAPSSAGMYYYGACVASVSGESNTGNNCSNGVRVTVSSSSGSGGGGGSSSPDLIVESPSVSDNTLTTGQSFTLSATVRNQGMGSSASTTLRYYRSSNTTISTSDTDVGTDSVNGLSASSTSAESISLNAPSSAGTYYYGACAESVSGESNTDNNCSSAVRVTVSRTTSGFAPADQQAFNSLVVGKRIDAETYFIDFESAGRVMEGYNRHPGSYTYSNTGANTGTLTQNYDAGLFGGRCTYKLTFTSTTTGTLSYTCANGLTGEEQRWQLSNLTTPIFARANADTLVFAFLDTWRAGQTRAYDFQVRKKVPQGSWQDLCFSYPNSSQNLVTTYAIASFTGAESNTTYEVRYRYRNSSSCNTGSPGAWSAISEGTTSSSGGGGGSSSGGGGGSSPDLIVESPSVSDNTLTTGQSFTLSATVRN